MINLLKISCCICITLIINQTHAIANDTDADLVLHNGKFYTLNWPDPDANGKPSKQAPFHKQYWHADANAVAIKNGLIVKVGDIKSMQQYITHHTKKINLKQAIVIPGLVDGHTHIEELGALLDLITLHGSKTPMHAINRVKQALKQKPVAKGQWILARGWDEGAWANNYPNAALLDKHFPDNPVFMDGAFGFAGWGNSAAMNIAGINNDTVAPTGGTIVKNKKGQPSGIVLNRAITLFRDAIPKPKHEKIKQQLLQGLIKMAQAGYVMVHQAGTPPEVMTAYRALADSGELPIRVYAMLSGRDKQQMKKWLQSGPYTDTYNYLFVRSVKGYYDGSLGARGAKLLQSYSDQANHFGISGKDYGFFTDAIAEMLHNGFQINIHAIGDASNREVLQFFESQFSKSPKMQNNRHRIEHAQIIHADDFAKYKALNIIASAQPPFVAEDKSWTTDRIGEDRAKGAYAWRSFRKHSVPMVFGSDLTGYDFNIYYGLHSVITRRDKSLQPENGWQAQEKLSSEEALLGYTRWAAYSAFLENQTGQLKTGMWADLTVLDTDVLNIGQHQPEKLFNGKVLMTIVAGKIVYDNNTD